MRADHAVISDITAACVALAQQPGQPCWYDTRPMTDPREHAPPQLDMAVQALQYARERGLVAQHPQHPHLVRITHHSQQA